MRLIIEDLEGATTVVDLGNEAVTIGRKPHNTIQLTEQNVSRSHAKLIVQDDGWLIQDLGSYNGVKVNGVPINRPTLLRESDLIQIGDYHLTLTDDVDRATVDIERPRTAANDGAITMGASTDLPSVSVEDLPPMRPPSMAPGDSAAYRTEAVTGAGEPKKNNTGVILAIIGFIVLVVVVGVGVVMSKSDDAGDGSTAAAGDGGKPEQAPEQVEQPEPQPEPVEVDTHVGEAVPEVDTGAEQDSAGAPDSDDSDDFAEIGELVETDTGDEPEPEPKTTTKSTTKSTPKTPKTTTPKLPPDQALAEARKASLQGNNRKAYSLAKDAYDQNGSSEALSVMGVAACKMVSESKAKQVYNKMTSAKDKQMLEKICKPLGIEL